MVLRVDGFRFILFDFVYPSGLGLLGGFFSVVGVVGD